MRSYAFHRDLCLLEPCLVIWHFISCQFWVSSDGYVQCRLRWNKYTFFLWLHFLFICIANMRPGAVQVGVWNTVDQWSFLEFVVGQTHLFPLAAFSVYLYHWRVQVLSKSECEILWISGPFSNLLWDKPKYTLHLGKIGTQTKVTVDWEPRFASSKRPVRSLKQISFCHSLSFLFFFLT